MKMPSIQAIAISAGALGVLLIGLYIAKKGVAGAAAGAVTAVADAGAGVVVGIGQAIGIPATNETECEAAKRLGEYWTASVKCPAADFISFTIGGLFDSEGAGH